MLIEKQYIFKQICLIDLLLLPNIQVVRGSALTLNISGLHFKGQKLKHNSTLFLFSLEVY